MEDVGLYASRFAYWFAKADEDAVSAGGSWYPRSRKFVERVAVDFELPKSVVAGVTAVLSPQVRWAQNKEYAVALCAGADTVPTFKSNVEKAKLIISGAPARTVVSGPKVEQFYRSLMGYDDATVIDTWMCRAAGVAQDRLTQSMYDQLSEALRVSSRAFGWEPAPYQAVVWTSIRGGGE